MLLTTPQQGPSGTGEPQSPAARETAGTMGRGAAACDPRLQLQEPGEAPRNPGSQLGAARSPSCLSLLPQPGRAIQMPSPPRTAPQCMQCPPPMASYLPSPHPTRRIQTRKDASIAQKKQEEVEKGRGRWMLSLVLFSLCGGFYCLEQKKLQRDRCIPTGLTALWLFRFAGRSALLRTTQL